VTPSPRSQPVQATRGGVDFDWIDLPPHLRADAFDGAYAQTLRLSPALSLSIVPPRTMFGGATVDFGWATQAHSWLLLVQQRLGGPRAQEIELSPTSRGTLSLRVVRSSGRLVADGTARATGDTFSFLLKIRCPPGTARIEGTLSRSGEWRFAATAPRDRQAPR
jgi:hypothetical protein